MKRDTLAIQGYDKVDYIVHIADIHIRNVQRHNEYRKVFQSVYDYIDKIKSQYPDKKGIVYLAGDIVHAKLEMSPELVSMTYTLFDEVSKRLPTILITGNHDCYSGDHEVLTSYGWVRIDDYVNDNRTDVVATFDSSKREIVFDSPTGLIKKRFAGDMVGIRSPNADMLVTPNHRVIHYTHANDKLSTRPASDIKIGMNIPVSGMVKEFVPDKYAELLGFSFADATFVEKSSTSHRVQFHFTKRRKIEYLSGLLDEIGYSYNVREQKDGTFYISIYSELATKIFQYFGGKKELKWGMVNEDRSFVRSFLTGYLEGDGSTSNKSFYSYTNINATNIEILGTMMHLVGAVSKVKLGGKFTGNYENSKIQYVGNCTFSNALKTTTVQDISSVPYDDDVYCLEVPTSYLLVRRNGKIFVSGNCNLKNSHRLDALTPIVSALENRNFHYLKDSGIYTLCDIDFIVWSVFDKAADFILPQDVESSNKKVVLYHGPVDRSGNDMGYEISNPSVTPDMFRGAYAGLLGDIHRYQYLNTAHTVCYPGSLVQQNHGESLKHGFVVWNFEGEKPVPTFVHVPNEYGYYTVDIDDGKIVNDMTDVPSKPRLRIRVANTSSTIVSQIVSKLKRDYEVDEYAVVPVNKVKGVSTAQYVREAMVDVRSVDYQNGLIKQYLESKHGIVDDETYEAVCEVNREMNRKTTPLNSIRSVVWIPKKFEFSNMFSYGEDNVVNFENLHGLYGLFGPNASGKSSVFDALMFCMFDKCSRTTKASEVMNNQTNEFKCSLDFDLLGKNYRIEKVATKGSKGNVKVDITFFTYEDGKTIPLNGKDRDETNSIIRSYIGSYDDFVLTTMALQTNGSNFTDKAQRERKDLLADFMDISIFDELYQIANEEAKEVKAVLKDYLKKDYYTIKHNALNEIDNLKQLKTSVEDDKVVLQSQIDSVSAEVNQLRVELRSVESDVKDIDIDSVQSNLSKYLVTVDKIEEELVSLRGVLAKETSEVDELSAVVNSFPEEDTTPTARDTYSVLLKDHRAISSEIAKLESVIQMKHGKLKKLHEEHEYDPNCKYCMNNVFVKDALETQDSVVVDEELLKVKKEQSDTLQKSMDEMSVRVRQYELYSEAVSNRNVADNKRMQTENSIVKKESDIVTIRTAIDKARNDIRRYESAKDDIQYNNTKEKRIGELNSEISELRMKVSKCDSSIIEYLGTIAHNQRLVEECDEMRAKIVEKERTNKALELYVKSVHRDGVPNTLISDTLPAIEREANSILSGITQFNVVFDMDGKNISTMIAYGEENYWPLELASGMERFIASLAIRSALVSITNLPKPNFIAIDEGFGVIDHENFTSVSYLFDYLKSQFDFIIIISHLDVLRDMVENIIEFTKIEGKSKLELL